MGTEVYSLIINFTFLEMKGLRNRGLRIFSENFRGKGLFWDRMAIPRAARR